MAYSGSLSRNETLQDFRNFISKSKMEDALAGYSCSVAFLRLVEEFEVEITEQSDAAAGGVWLDGFGYTNAKASPADILHPGLGSNLPRSRNLLNIKGKRSKEDSNLGAGSPSQLTSLACLHISDMLFLWC